MDTKRSLKVGLVLPIGEEELGGHTARWTDLLAMARAARARAEVLAWPAVAAQVAKLYHSVL